MIPGNEDLTETDRELLRAIEWSFVRHRRVRTGRACGSPATLSPRASGSNRSLASASRAGCRALAGEPRLTAAEIRAFHALIDAQRARFVVQDDSAGLEDVAVVGNFEREVGVLFHEQDGDA